MLVYIYIKSQMCLLKENRQFYLAGELIHQYLVSFHTNLDFVYRNKSHLHIALIHVSSDFTITTHALCIILHHLQNTHIIVDLHNIRDNNNITRRTKSYY